MVALLSARGPAGGTAALQPARAGVPPAPVVLSAPLPTSTGVRPLRVSIPAIGVASDLVALGVDGHGALVPPADFGQVGWFAAGTVPGDVGPAVLAGHVDSYRGPAVFYRLRELRPGDRVQVTRSDGRTVVFSVTRLAEYPKDRFATAEVYGPTAGPQLRLVTCGGAFDRSKRSYLDNVVVYAQLD